ncbi:MAG: rubredoxin-like domain-containing protein [Armatimonadota bacterium]
MAQSPIWKCSNCNLVCDCDEAPDQCPRCGAPKEDLKQLDDNAAELVRRSRLSNDLHMKLATLLEKVIEVGKAGEEDNLDPTCVQIFLKAQQDATMLRQWIKAEIEGHQSKGKWG